MTFERLLIRDAPAGSPLDAYAHRVTSQFGEDGILARLIELIDPPRYFVEFGALDGVHYSNCRQLIEAGWHGAMIEADAERFATLRENCLRPGVSAVNRVVHFEGDDRLDKVLRECDAPREIGVMSIDVDGADYHIWKPLELYAPEIVVIEFNPTVPNDVYFVQERSIDVYHGSSLLAMTCLAKQKGYELVACTPTNAIFVIGSKFPLTGVTDSRIETLYQPIRDGRIFQGYDGTIFVVGMHDLVWAGVNITDEDYQVLPKSMRVYRDARLEPKE